MGDLSLLRNARWLAALALILLMAAAGSFFAGRAIAQTRVRELPSPAILKTPAAPGIVFPALPITVAPLRLPVVVNPGPVNPGPVNPVNPVNPVKPVKPPPCNPC